jgi:hypothetical protein
MNCFGCGAPVSGALCAYCGTPIGSSTDAALEIEVTPALQRLGLEDTAASILGDGGDLEQTTHRLAEWVEEFWEAGELKKADALVRVFSKRLPRHDKINLMLAKTSFLFGLSTIKESSTAHIGQRFLKEAKQHLDAVTESQYEPAVSELLSKIESTETKTVSAYTVWDDDDEATAAAKKSMRMLRDGALQLA